MVGDDPEHRELLNRLVSSLRDRVGAGLRPHPRIGTRDVPHACFPQLVRTVTQCFLQAVDSGVELLTQLLSIDSLAPPTPSCRGSRPRAAGS